VQTATSSKAVMSSLGFSIYLWVGWGFFSYPELLQKYVSCFIAVVMMSNELRAIGLSLTFILNYCLLCLYTVFVFKQIGLQGNSSTLQLEDEEKESGLFFLSPAKFTIFNKE